MEFVHKADLTVVGVQQLMRHFAKGFTEIILIKLLYIWIFV